MRKPLALLSLFLATCCPPAPAPKQIAKPVPPPAPVPEVALEGLAEGQHVHGFTAVSLYLDGADRPIGARFVHDHTGFTFDYLRIESAPQGFIWVSSFPTSDKGEPHTQEHLLLGKGDRGRKLGSFEAMALAQSSAFTAQWRTAYHFHTVAGPDVFWPVFENQLDALLHPDYTDEEIRREVRNFGVDTGSDGKLRLEEKGTVYNEMVRTYESPDTMLWRTAGQLVYGAHHPLALESGGFPDAIRTMTPEDIRAFHGAAYHLVNMGMVGAFPSAMTLASVLDHTAKLLDDKADGKGTAHTEAQLPAPAGASAGTLATVEYPYSDAVAPGPYLFAWPATRKLDDTERTLLGLFLDAFAGDASTTLYKELIDSKTRTLDLGASAVWSSVSTDQGQPIYLGVNGVKADKLDEKGLSAVRAVIAADLARIASLPDGAPELVALDARVLSRVTDLRRKLNKFLDTPPGFGFRGTSAAWMDHLEQLDRSAGFKKSLVLAPALAAIEAALAGGHNPWHDRMARWGLAEVPYGVAARPSPALRAKIDADRQKRIDDELDRLTKQYGTGTAAEALVRYQADYAVQTKKIEEAATRVALPPLVDSPPMTLDDLHYAVDDASGAKAFRATVDSMASARVSLAFALDVVPSRDLALLALLPQLLSDVGVLDGGAPIAADEVRERIRKEILDLDVHYSENVRTHRHELVVSGAGNAPKETALALGWMRRVMTAPDWRPENVARLRDVIDQAITALRQRMQGPEESWVDDARDAWIYQDQRLHTHTHSFLVREHDLLGLRWALEEPADATVKHDALQALYALGKLTKLTRAELTELATAIASSAKPKAAKLARLLPGKLSDAARAIVAKAAKDLATRLPDMADESLAEDWRYLIGTIATSLNVGAKHALGELETTRRALIQRANVRIVEVGSPAHEAAIANDLAALIGALGGDPVTHDPALTEPHPVATKVLGRETGITTAAPPAPMFVGLYAPATSSGVFLDVAPGPTYADATDDAVLDYLTSNLYTGHGAHSVFMKTWGAGLAYSNGLHSSLGAGTIDYYAERCPLLPTTLQFVIDQLQRATPDANIARYAVAQAFRSRIADDYETRAAAMAADLVDGVTPEVVRAFRAKVVAAAKRPDLATVLFARMPKVYGKVLPGYGGAPAPASTYFVIGPGKQLDAYAAYLAALPGAPKLHRLYARDFWLPL